MSVRTAGGDMTPESAGEPAAAITASNQALLLLAESQPELATFLGRLTSVVAAQATSSGRFASALSAAFTAAPTSEAASKPAPQRRTGRRAPGPIDPFDIYRTSGDEGLRAALAALNLEQLRDIVAEHGMDSDRLAMRWRDPSRIAERIVERVAARTEKGSAFREPAAARRERME